MNINELDQDLQKVKEKTPDLYSDVFHASIPFHMFHRKLLGDADEILKKKYNLNSTELDVLASLYYSGGDEYVLSPTQLMQRLLFSSSNLAKILKRLEKPSYIVRIANAEDKRSNLVQLTSKGQEVLLSASMDLKLSDEKCFQGLNSDEIKDLKQLLIKAIKGVS